MSRKTLKRLALALAMAVGAAHLFPNGYSLAADADEREQVTIASFSFPPILHTATSGDFSGTMGETVKVLCEKAGLDCDFVVVPLKRAYQHVRTGAADALVTIDVGQLTDCCVASDWSAPWTDGFFSTGETPIPDKPEDLINQSLIVVSGMKSPYSFAADLDQMADDGRVALSKAPDVLTSVRMFLNKRAPLLWGGEDFKWYLGKLDPAATYTFAPRFERPVVVWVRQDRADVLARLNQAYRDLSEAGTFGKNGLLRSDLMQQRYQDAPLNE